MSRIRLRSNLRSNLGSKVRIRARGRQGRGKGVLRSSKRIAKVTALVAAVAGRQGMSPADLLGLIAKMNTSLEPPAPRRIEKPDTAAILASIKPHGLMSFENGKTYTMLKRHLAHCGLTVEEYKEKWGLPDNYPIAAPAYSALRSQMAKDQGLGRNGQPKPWKSSSKTRAAAQMAMQSPSPPAQQASHA